MTDTPQPKQTATSLQAHKLVLGERYHATPVKGIIIPNPERANAPLPPTGCNVVWATYWHQCLLDEALTVTKPE